MPKINRTVLRALEILESLNESQTKTTLTDISNKLELPRSSAFDIINTLQHKGYIEIDNAELKTYKLGLKAFEVGAGYLSRVDLISISKPYLEEIMLYTKATSFMAIENKGKLVYMDKVEPNTAIRTTAVLGSRKPMYCTGLGKALLAAFDNEKCNNILDHTEYLRLTPYTIDTKEKVMEDLQKIRKRGYALDIRESQDMISCVAAPIYDVNGKAIAAISIAALHTTMTELHRKDFAKHIIGAALDISKKMGYGGNQLY